MIAALGAPAQEGVPGFCQADSYPHVRAPDAVRPGDDGIEVQLADLREIIGEPGDPQQRIGERGGVHRRRAPAAGQQRRGVHRVDHLLGVGQRGKPGHLITVHLGGHTAGPEHHQRPEYWLLRHADVYLDAAGQHRLDEQATGMPPDRRSTLWGRRQPSWQALTLMRPLHTIHLGPNVLEVHVPAQHGFFGPRSATGSAALLPDPPWHYSGDLLTIEYRVNPDRVRELLPGPLEPAGEDPGAVAFIWADWQSCAADKAQLLDPVLGQYKEAFVVVRCSYRGETFSRCAYIWVDSDFAIARGLHQGYPKKLGSIHMTRPHPYGPAPRVAPGGQFGASLAAADRRLAEAQITLLNESPANGFVNAYPMAHNRFVRAIDDPSKFRLDEIIATASASAEGGPAFRARVDGFQLFPAPTEELDRLAPEEIIGGYYRQVGVVWDGGRLLHDNLAVPEQVPAEVTEHV